MIIKKTTFAAILLFSGLAFSSGNEIIVTSIHSVYDGDTFRAYLPDGKNKSERIRLRDVDTAEIQGKCQFEINEAIKARDFVRQYLASAGQVKLKNTGRDKYNRLLADVYVDEVNLSHVLINRGLGREWRGRRESWCN